MLSDALKSGLSLHLHIRVFGVIQPLPQSSHIINMNRLLDIVPYNSDC